MEIKEEKENEIVKQERKIWVCNTRLRVCDRELRHITKTQEYSAAALEVGEAGDHFHF